MYTKEKLIKLSDELKNEIEHIQSVYGQQPINAVVHSKLQNGKRKLVEVSMIEDKRKRRTLKVDDPYTKSIICGMVLKNYTSALEDTLEKINRCIGNVKDDSLSAAIAKVRDRYPLLTTQYLSSCINNANSALPESPVFSQYEQSSYLSECKIHTTSQGLMVRSKSEVIIAEKLYQFDVPFIYEPVIHLGDKTFIPDFLAWRPNGKKYIGNISDL